MRRISNGWSVAAIVALALVTAGCDNGGSATASPANSPPEVGVVIVQPEPVTLTRELSGRIAPHLIAEVRPQVGGIIQKRLFSEGSEVKAGQVLYQIDPATYRAAYNSAKATLARAEANLGAVQLREERYRELVQIDAVSRQDFDDAGSALKQARAEVEAARAAVETARINLDYTSVKAPISGRIGRSTVTTGALVTANQPTELATIQQLDPIYVDVTQSSADMLRLRQALASGLLKSNGSEQAKVGLLLEDGSSYPLEGTLKFSEVTVDQSTGSVTLRTIFPNPGQQLLPGMYARAVVQEGVAEQAILVPQQGVGRNAKGEPVALVVDAAGEVQQRVLTLDRAIGDRWLVAAGLAPGERLVVEGSQRVRPGATVKAVAVEAKSGQGVVDATAASAERSGGGA